MNKTSYLAVLAALAAVLALPVPVGAQNWTWSMPGKLYGNLDFDKRAVIDRASAAYERAERAGNQSFNDVQLPLFRSASAEWQKFRVQFELDTTIADAVFAYALFMQAYSLQGARDRFSAIKLYNELLDFYAEEHWITPAALYMIAMNHLGNDDKRKAAVELERLVGNPQMLDHALACNAFERLGNYYWEQEKYARAEEFWRNGAQKKYLDISRDACNRQQSLVRDLLALEHRWNNLTEHIFAEIPDDRLRLRMNAVVANEDALFNNQRGWWLSWFYDKKYGNSEKKKRDEIAKWNKNFIRWHEGFKPLYMEDKRDWQYAVRTMNFRLVFDSVEAAKKFVPELEQILKASDAKVIVGRVNELCGIFCDYGMFEEARGLLKHLKNEADISSFCRLLGDRLCKARKFIEARLLIPYIKNPLDALWFTYEIDMAAGDYPACVVSLEAIIANNDPRVSLAGKKALASLYKNRIRDYEKAIKLYVDIAEPPGTLWDIYACYRALGSRNKSYAMLQEITFFPDHTVRAIFRMAEDRLADGEKDLAVGLYRRLLAQPEWKKTGESSLAHQRLEALGIKTGGAVISDVR